MNPGAKFYCSPGKWERMARAAAVEAGLDPVRLLAGEGDSKHLAVRWRLWRELIAAGHSYASVGRACGFHHASIRRACIIGHEPRMWKRRLGFKEPRRVHHPQEQKSA